MEVNITEFRRNTKQYFDAALQGEPVCIERGSVHYNLIARLPGGVEKTEASKPVELTYSSEKKPEAAPDVLDGLFSKPAIVSGELMCCLNEEQPCKHWSWDGNRLGYVNSLSGRFMEVD